MPMPGKMKDKGDSGLLIALGGPEKPGGVPEPEGDESSMDAVKDLATDDFMAAVESGDRVAGKDALTRFVKACMSSEDY